MCLLPLVTAMMMTLQGMGSLAVLLLHSLPELQAVAVSSCSSLQNLDLRGLSESLKYLDIRGCESLRDVVGATELVALTRLVVADCRHLKCLKLEVKPGGAQSLTVPNLLLPKVRSGLYTRHT
jgi:hypothetical protein